MKNKTLTLVSLIISLIGISLLFLIAKTSNPEELTISEILSNTEDHLGKEITTQGTIIKATYKENINFLNIKDNSSKLLIVFFDDPKIQLKKNNIIKVTGKLQFYESKLEILASEIDCIKCS